MRTVARLALVVISLASAVWLLPASAHIAGWPADGPLRIAYLAPGANLWLALVLSIVLVAGAVGVGVVSGRPVETIARILTPLGVLLAWLVPYLPWLPDRAPLLLVLAGPLRWTVAALAVAGVASRWAADRRLRRLGEGTTVRILTGIRVDRRAILIASFVVYAVFGVRFAKTVGFSGDAPHYLIITQSLLADHDLNIENNHAQRDYRAFFRGVLAPDYLRRGRHGEIYSIHAPGLPALLIPAYAVAGPIGAVMFMALMSALAALAVFECASLVAGERAAIAVWAGTCLTVPFVPHAWLIYPEIPGALIAARATLWLWQPPASPGRAAWHGTVLALLPWLHTKFSVLLALFAIFEIVRLWPRVKAITAFLTPIVVASTLWVLSFYWMYGVLDPQAPYGEFVRRFVLVNNIPRGTLGVLFDQKFGLLAYSPFFVTAAIGAWLMVRDRGERWRAAALLAAVATFVSGTTRMYMWWGGSSPPARFLVPMVPLLAPFIAVGVARTTSLIGRATIATSLAISLAIAVVAIGSPRESLLYSDPHGVASLVTAVQGGGPLDVSLPTFTEGELEPAVSALWPWLVAAALAYGVAAAAVRAGLLGSPFGVTVTAASTMLLAAALLADAPPASARRAIASQGQLALMEQYDPTRLRTASLSRLARLDASDTLAAATLSVRQEPGAEELAAGVAAGPYRLPEGQYEARIWFEGAHPPAGEVSIDLSPRVTLARMETSCNPCVLPFELPVAARAFVGVSSGDVARGVRRIEIAPRAIVPRSQRGDHVAHTVEPVDGGRDLAYIGYADFGTYPEGGVFWTRDAEAGRVMIATAGARTLRLIVHVGPNGGPVEIEAGGARYDVEMQANETREITVPLAPGTTRIDLSVRASRSFVPAEVDKRSDDTRRLGCQIRPVLS